MVLQFRTGVHSTNERRAAARAVGFEIRQASALPDARAANIARARELLAVPSRPEQPDTSATAMADEPRMLPRPCPCCRGRMMIIETFARGYQPKHGPTPAAFGNDTS